MLDLSAAFDMVDHSILFEKLPLCGFDTASLEWVRSYLSGRSQCVQIEGSLSRKYKVDIGVPQGSILGLWLYSLFTNELPEVINCNHHQVKCDKENGSVICYADDSTLTSSDSNPIDLSEKLSKKLFLHI